MSYATLAIVFTALLSCTSAAPTPQLDGITAVIPDNWWKQSYPLAPYPSPFGCQYDSTLYSSIRGAFNPNYCQQKRGLHENTEKDEAKHSKRQLDGITAVIPDNWWKQSYPLAPYPSPFGCQYDSTLYSSIRGAFNPNYCQQKKRWLHEDPENDEEVEFVGADGVEHPKHSKRQLDGITAVIPDNWWKQSYPLAPYPSPFGCQYDSTLYSSIRGAFNPNYCQQ